MKITDPCFDRLEIANRIKAWRKTIASFENKLKTPDPYAAKGERDGWVEKVKLFRKEVKRLEKQLADS